MGFHWPTGKLPKANTANNWEYVIKRIWGQGAAAVLGTVQPIGLVMWSMGSNTELRTFLSYGCPLVPHCPVRLECIVVQSGIELSPTPPRPRPREQSLFNYISYACNELGLLLILWSRREKFTWNARVVCEVVSKRLCICSEFTKNKICDKLSIRQACKVKAISMA